MPFGTPWRSQPQDRRRGLGAFDGFWKEALEKYGGLVEGRDFYTQRLTDDYPLFSAFFDLRGGAPIGGASYRGMSIFNVVEGFYVKGQLEDL